MGIQATCCLRRIRCMHDGAPTSRRRLHALYNNIVMPLERDGCNALRENQQFRVGIGKKDPATEHPREIDAPRDKGLVTCSQPTSVPF